METKCAFAASPSTASGRRFDWIQSFTHSSNPRTERFRTRRVGTITSSVVVETLGVAFPRTTSSMKSTISTSTAILSHRSRFTVHSSVVASPSLVASFSAPSWSIPNSSAITYASLSPMSISTTTPAATTRAPTRRSSFRTRPARRVSVT